MDTKAPIPRAVLVGIQTPEVDDVAHEASLQELGRLVRTLGYEVAGTVSQKREGTGAGSLLGSGRYCQVVREGPAMDRGRRLGSPTSRGAGHLSPGLERGGASGTVLVGGEAMATKLEVGVDAGMGGQEALGVPG